MAISKGACPTFKVWVQVEKLDVDKNEYDNVGLPDSLGEFDTFEQATAHIRSLPGWDFYPASTSDYREED